MKKYLLPALVIMIVLQLFVPVYMIANKYDILRNGEEYKFKVAPVDPYDAFRGRYVWISYRLPQDIYWKGMYGEITVGEDGFAEISKITNAKPREGAYVVSKDKSHFTMPFDRYYMDERFAPRAERLTRSGSASENAYVTVRVKNGSLVVSGLYIDGVPIEDIIKKERDQ